MSALPPSAKILIVGAGPVGITTAISLVAHGCSKSDIIIVEASHTAQTSRDSRATSIHAATLEALDTINCAAPLIQHGRKTDQTVLHNRESTGSLHVSMDFTTLVRDTKYPFVLAIAQDMTEGILREQLEGLGVHVYRPYRVNGMEGSGEDGTMRVTFENGESIVARYIIGTDGGKSVIRQSAGINFADPDTGTNAPVASDAGVLKQIVLADITFSRPLSLPSNINFVESPESFSLLVRLPKHNPKYQAALPTGADPDADYYRVGLGVPASMGVPPSHPGVEYLQPLVDAYSVREASSRPDVNPNPVVISEVRSSSRYRPNSAVADKLFTRLGHPRTGAVVLLVGDAGHIHSPIGGQGLNLGLRDAITLAPTLLSHMASTNDSNAKLTKWAETRYKHALAVIGMTKKMVWLANGPVIPWVPLPAGVVRKIRLAVMAFLGRFVFVRRKIALGLSGLLERMTEG